jgi:hypothetical protein
VFFKHLASGKGSISEPGVKTWETLGCCCSSQ